MSNINKVKFGGKDLATAKSLTLNNKSVKQIKLNNNIIWPLFTENIWLEDINGNKITATNPLEYYYTSNSSVYVYLKYNSSIYPNIENITVSPFDEGITDAYGTTIVLAANYDYDGEKNYTVYPLDANMNYIYDENGNQVSLVLYCLYDRYNSKPDEESNYLYEELVVYTGYYDVNAAIFTTYWRCYNLNTGETEYLPCYSADYGEVQADGMYSITDELSSSGNLYAYSLPEMEYSSYIEISFQAAAPNGAMFYATARYDFS